MGKAFLVVGLLAGVVVAATVGRKRITELWERPEVQDSLTKANRFVADKAPTLHGFGEAVVDALPTRKAS
jgi:hypothetical protein